MDFFAHQRVARRQSQVLLLVFLLAMLGIAAFIHVVVVGLSVLLGSSASLAEPTLPASVAIALVWIAIILGGFFRSLDVRAGGAVLARRFGAVQASDRSRHGEEKKLLNVVAEMAIASSCPPPDVFVLRREISINAFVVGSFEDKHAIVVSQGALDVLDSDELQSVVAHEFGHISQGDIPLNMRLLIVLSGLMAVDEVGRLLTGDEPDQLAHPGVLLGFLLRGLGSVGVAFGMLIRAAFSRQREYLADASAVQFTRNPIGLASALARIRDEGRDQALHGVHAQELTHLCFQVNAGRSWYRKLFSSHPPLQSRIDAIDKHFAIKLRKRRNAKAKRAGSKRKTGGGTAGNAAANTENTIMQLQPLSREDSLVDCSGLDERVLFMLPDTSACLAVLFALFASDDASRREQFISAIGFAYNQKFADRVKELYRDLSEELHTSQLDIIEYATSQLRTGVKFDNRQRLLINLERLLVVEGEYSLINYATLQLIRRQLDVDFPVLDARANDDSSVASSHRVKTFDNMGNEFALLLSLMVESSGAPAAVLDKEFKRVLKCYTQVAHPRRTGKEPGIIEELEAAFQTLSVQPAPIRQAFVQHCVEIMQGDGHVARAEQALLDLFAASLKCQLKAA